MIKKRLFFGNVAATQRFTLDSLLLSIIILGIAGKDMPLRRKV
jgi:hypothetical protein